MISVENISKNFGDNLLFKNFSFEINKGEKVCLVADSGKGKSTLIKILLGLENIDSGKILIYNKELNTNNISEIRKQIAWLPQDLGINIEKAEELIELFEIDKNIFLTYLSKLDIKENLLMQNFQSLSGGQKQRVLLASCLSLEKPILFLDEPTSALDKTSIQLLINTIMLKKNLTVVSSSHNKDWMNVSRIIRI